MSNNLALKKGLDVPIKGAAKPEVIKTVSPDIVAVKPTDIHGLVPRLLVKEGSARKSSSPAPSVAPCSRLSAAKRENCWQFW